MKFLMHFLIPISVVVDLAACAPAAQEPAEQETRNTESDSEAVTKLEEEWNEAFESGDVDALANMITDDFVAMPPNEPALVGKEAYLPWIREFLAGFEDENTNTESDVSADELVVDRDWAFVRATVSWATTPAAGGDPTAEGQVSYIHIMRREPDGSWKLARDLWNEDNPPAGS